MSDDYKNDPKYIESKKTKISTEEATYALRQAWKIIFTEYPINNSLAILFAQWALETGRGASCYNYNFGNIKTGKSHTGYHQYYRCSEIINGKEIFFDPPHIQCKFRAYKTATAGAIDYINLIAKRKRYVAAFEALKEGNVTKYVKALKVGGYFTASLSHYMRIMNSITKEFHRKKDKLLAWKPPEKEDPKFLTDDEKKEIMNLVNATNNQSIDEYFSRSDKYDDEEQESYFEVVKKPWWKIW